MATNERISSRDRDVPLEEQEEDTKGEISFRRAKEIARRQGRPSESAQVDHRSDDDKQEDTRTDEETSLDFMRGRDSDYIVDDENSGDGLPIENLYSSAGLGDLHREGDAAEALTDLPDVPTDARVPQDDRIRAAVVEAIESEVGEGLNIQISVDSGIVTLEGDVDDEGVKDLISETVETVPGVLAVNNVLFLQDPAVSS